MHTTYHISITPKDQNDTRQFWFQSGKLTTKPDFLKNASSHKSFRTKEKIKSFLRWLDMYYPDTVVHVWETRKGNKEIMYEIPMGNNWKNYLRDWQV